MQATHRKSGVWDYWTNTIHKHHLVRGKFTFIPSSFPNWVGIARKCQWDWKGTSQFLKRALASSHLTLSERTSLRRNQIHLQYHKLWHAFPFPHRSHFHGQPSPAVSYLCYHTLLPLLPYSSQWRNLVSMAAPSGVTVRAFHPFLGIPTLPPQWQSPRLSLPSHTNCDCEITKLHLEIV